jgi:hypothetical protein
MNPDINTMPLPNTNSSSSSTGSQPVVPVPSQMPSGVAPAAPVASSRSINPGGKPANVETEADFGRRWAAAAKTIVAQTKYDPYLQSSELSKVGMEYRKELQSRS